MILSSNFQPEMLWGGNRVSIISIVGYEENPSMNLKNLLFYILYLSKLTL